MGFGKDHQVYLSKKREPLKWTPAQIEARKRRLGLLTVQEYVDQIVRETKKEVKKNE